MCRSKSNLGVSANTAIARHGVQTEAASNPCVRTLEADPAWGVLVDFLLLHLTGTGGDGSSLSEFEESPRYLHDLTKALLRQQRHLAEMGSARTPKLIVDPNILVTAEEIVTHEGVWVCPDCGNPTSFPRGD